MCANYFFFLKEAFHLFSSLTITNSETNYLKRWDDENDFDSDDDPSFYQIPRYVSFTCELYINHIIINSLMKER